jgi:molybdate transport system substrate-binding protein
MELRMKLLSIAVSAAMLVTVAVRPGTSQTAEIRVLSSTALADVLRERGPVFELSTGHKLVIELDTSTGVKRKIEAGARLDIAIATPLMIADLARQGKLTPGQGTGIAQVGYGVAIRAGAPRPDISSTDAFRETLLAAKSVMYNKEGQSGIHMAAVMQRLGIEKEMRSRTIQKTVSGPVAADIANGEAELGFQSIAEILPVQGAELLGPLPPELQAFTQLAAGIAADSTVEEVARQFIVFLTTPESVQVMKKYGMEPMRR